MTVTTSLGQRPDPDAHPDAGKVDSPTDLHGPFMDKEAKEEKARERARGLRRSNGRDDG